MTTSAPAGVGRWTVIIPVKELSVAKSRLGADPSARATLALAMARDVVGAALACGGVESVLIITDDEHAEQVLAPLAWVEADAPHAGLSAALAHGARIAAKRWPDAGIVAVSADLPALTSRSLHQALVAAAAHPRGVVADAEGVGTVLLSARPGEALAPDYEGSSFAAHRAGGAIDLTPAADDRLRRDVDTVADLVAAVALGVGAATTAAVAAWRSAGWLD